MILGQAMESSAGDPTQAGTIRSEFFYHPFVAGDLGQHANCFYDIVRGLPHLNYYLLNTGWVGEGEHYLDIRLEFTMEMLDSLFRQRAWKIGLIRRRASRYLAAVRVVDDIFLHPEKLYSQSELKRRKTNEPDAVRRCRKGRKRAAQKYSESFRQSLRVRRQGQSG